MMVQEILTIDEIEIIHSSIGMKNKIILVIYSYVILKPIKIFLQNILHLELPPDSYKKKIRMPHIYNIIINQKSKIGNNVTIYHNITIGSKQFGSKIGTPEIGDNVIIYPNTCIIGNVKIGDNSIIGAGSIVTNDVEAFSVMIGNPAKKIGSIKPGLKK